MDKNQEEDSNNFGIFGIEIHRFSSIGSYVYITIVAIILLGAFIWGFKQLNNSSLPVNKKKKQKVKKQK